jgi:hypothetical protein
MAKRVQIELVLRATKDGKTLHEISMPIHAEWNLQPPEHLADASGMLTLSEHELIECLAQSYIETARDAPIKTMMVDLIHGLALKTRKAPNCA